MVVVEKMGWGGIGFPLAWGVGFDSCVVGVDAAVGLVLGVVAAGVWCGRWSWRVVARLVW